MEQRYVLKNIKDFEPRHILSVGSVLDGNWKWIGSYTCVFGENVVNVKKNQSEIIFRGICDGEIQEVVTRYFDLNYDYGQAKVLLSKKDKNLEQGIEYGYGIRILNQSLWEVIISFIISANNNIPRIKKSIQALSENYGKKIKWDNKTYYTFPTPEELSKASVSDLRKLGLGFRDKRVHETTRIIYERRVKLKRIARRERYNFIKRKINNTPRSGTQSSGLHNVIWT